MKTTNSYLTSTLTIKIDFLSKEASTAYFLIMGDYHLYSAVSKTHTANN